MLDGEEVLPLISTDPTAFVQAASVGGARDVDVTVSQPQITGDVGCERNATTRNATGADDIAVVGPMQGLPLCGVALHAGATVCVCAW